MKRAKSILTFLIVALNIGMFSQGSFIDSVKNVLRQNINDTNRIITLYNLSWNYLESDLDSATRYNKIGTELALKTNNQKKLAYLLDELGYIYLYRGQYEAAIIQHFEALKVHESINNLVGASNSLNGIGFVYNTQSNFDRALVYYLKSLEISKRLNRKKQIGLSLKYIGGIQRYKGNSKLALQYLFEALSYFNKTEAVLDVADIYLDIAGAYLITNNSDSALYFGFKALEGYEKITNQLARTADVLSTIGSAYVKRKDFKNALKYNLESYNLAVKLGLADVIKVSGLNLAETYTLNKDFENAFKYERMAYVLLDSINGNNNVGELEHKYLKEKEDAIRLKEEEIHAYKEKIDHYILFGIIAVFVLLSLFIYLRYKNKKKANDLLQEKNKIIEEKQKEILDSIHYAKRIQKSLITNEKYIEKELNRLTEKGSEKGPK